MGTDDVATLLAGWREAAEAATPGPWEVTGIGDDDIWSDALGGFVGEASYPNDAGFIVTARTALPRLVAAVEAVLKLHQPVTTNGGWLEGREWQECEACGPNNGCEHVIASPGQGESFWPCPTVEAITAALTGEEASDGN